MDAQGTTYQNAMHSSAYSSGEIDSATPSPVVPVQPGCPSSYQTIEGMSDKELRRLKRIDLLEMLVEQGREIERLKAELRDTRQRLEDRDILLSSCGSIAEAALKLNGIFKAAQDAADQYVHNVQRMADQGMATSALDRLSRVPSPKDVPEVRGRA